MNIGITEPGTTVAAVVDPGQRTIHGTLARRESAIAVVDIPIDARRGVGRRIRVHARYVFPDWTP